MLYAGEDKKHRIIQIFHRFSKYSYEKKRNDSDLGIILQVEHDKYFSYRIFHMGYTFINAREEWKFDVEGKEVRRDGGDFQEEWRKGKGKREA